MGRLSHKGLARLKLQVGMGGVLPDFRVSDDQEQAGDKPAGLPEYLSKRPLLASIIIVRLILSALLVLPVCSCLDRCFLKNFKGSFGIFSAFS